MYQAFRLKGCGETVADLESRAWPHGYWVRPSSVNEGQGRHDLELANIMDR